MNKPIPFILLPLLLITFTLALLTQQTSPTPAGNASPSPGQPASPTGLTLTLQPFATGLDTPSDIAHAGDDRLFIVEQPGRIRLAQPDGTLRPTPFLDITDRVTDLGNEPGLLGLAFHPAYPVNGQFYVYYTRDTNGSALGGIEIVLSQFLVTQNPDLADPNSETILLAIPKYNGMHNGGDLTFGPDGYLYIPTGDGGQDGDPNNLAQNPNTLLGKILRIDVDGHGQPPDCYPGPYTIPPDNPLTGPTACDEIWALGLRNPWRIHFDTLTGDLFIADVGDQLREEINLQPASSPGGENYGWHCYEGTQVYTTTNCAPPDTYTLPIFEYEHLDIHCAVVGGIRYRGTRSPAMYGTYFLTDWCSGHLWSLTSDAVNGWIATDLGDFGMFLTTFGTDMYGEIYLASSRPNQGDTVYRLIGPPASYLSHLPVVFQE